MPRSRSPALFLALACLAVLLVQGCAARQPSAGDPPADEQLLRVSRLQLVDLAKGIQAARDQQLITPATYLRLRQTWQDVAERHQQLLDIWRAKAAVADRDAEALVAALTALITDLAVSRAGHTVASAGGGEVR